MQLELTTTSSRLAVIIRQFLVEREPLSFPSSSQKCWLQPCEYDVRCIHKALAKTQDCGCLETVKSDSDTNLPLIHCSDGHEQGARIPLERTEKSHQEQQRSRVHILRTDASVSKNAHSNVNSLDFHLIVVEYRT